MERNINFIIFKQEKAKVTHRVGNIYKINDDFAILATIDRNRLSLISLRDGNRYSDAILNYNATSDQIQKYFESEISVPWSLVNPCSVHIMQE